MFATHQAPARQRVALIGLGALGQRLAAQLQARPESFELLAALHFPRNANVPATVSF